MNFRYLLVLSFVIMALSMAYYRHHDEMSVPSGSKAVSNVGYEAKDILAIQTNSQGDIEYALTADSLTHLTDKNQDRLESIVLNWRPQTQKFITLQANETLIDYDTQAFVMSHNVTMVNRPSSQSNLADITSSQTPSAFKSAVSKLPVFNDASTLTLEASELIGNIDQKTLMSNTPLRVSQAENEFEAGSMQANLASGEYDFSRVADTFAPPKRKDTPLF